MTSPSNPLDPETIKIPAFQRKKSLNAKARHVLPWTALDRKNIGSAIPDGVRNVKSMEQSARSAKRVMTFAPHDIQAPNFQRISLEQTSILDSASQPRRYVLVGEVTMVLTKISVGIIKVSQSIKLNNVLLFEGDNCMYEEVVCEMQIDRKNVKTAKKGAEIGVKMKVLPQNGTRVWRAVKDL